MLFRGRRKLARTKEMLDSVDVPEHLLVRGSRRSGSPTQHLGVPILRKRFLQHVNDTQVDRTGLHERVAEMWQDVVEIARTGEK